MDGCACPPSPFLHPPITSTTPLTTIHIHTPKTTQHDGRRGAGPGPGQHGRPRWPPRRLVRPRSSLKCSVLSLSVCTMYARCRVRTRSSMKNYCGCLMYDACAAPTSTRRSSPPSSHTPHNITTTTTKYIQLRAGPPVPPRAHAPAPVRLFLALSLHTPCPLPVLTPLLRPMRHNTRTCRFQSVGEWRTALLQTCATPVVAKVNQSVNWLLGCLVGWLDCPSHPSIPNDSPPPVLSPTHPPTTSSHSSLPRHHPGALPPHDGGRGAAPPLPRHGRAGRRGETSAAAAAEGTTEETTQQQG